MRRIEMVQASPPLRDLCCRSSTKTENRKVKQAKVQSESRQRGGNDSKKEGKHDVSKAAQR
jgi:hypothetical protein